MDKDSQSDKKSLCYPSRQMATYHISRLPDGKYKVIREKREGMTHPISLDRVSLEIYLKGGHSDPGALDVLTALDRGESVAVEMDN